jgi:glycosyltransferase involved in cell wall biosynthesis
VLGDLDSALRWLAIAAHRASVFPFGYLASADLEAQLLTVAGQLERPSPTSTSVGLPETPRTGAGPSRWLHVFTEAQDIGGHTAMAARWFALDRERVHSAVLLDQGIPVPTFFRAAVNEGGGGLRQLDPRAPLRERAAQLRALARAEADVVVLHAHSWDVIPAVAFGVDGGPPVLRVNHGDHAFWAGVAVVDLVLDLRPPGQEWTQRYRGLSRTALLPIVVPEPESVHADRERAMQRRAAAKAQLGLPADSLVLLTVARGVKYTALPGRDLDFLAAAQAILRARPRAWLLAVGPGADARWRAARRATGGRVRAEGPQGDLDRYHAAADVYLESFPLGSATAMVEAAIRGLPCVPSPRVIPSSLSTGGPGIVAVEEPQNVPAYVRQVLTLLDSEATRQASGERVAAAVRTAHGPAGWLARLGAVVERLPPAHRVHSLPIPEPLPAGAVAFWSEWSARMWPGRAEAALYAWLEPRADGRHRTARGIRRLAPAVYALGYGQCWDLWRRLRRARARRRPAALSAERAASRPGTSGGRRRSSP